MVTEVPADLSWESRSVAFVQPVLVVGHESSIGEDKYVRVGVDPAKMFGRKAGRSRYVVDVDQPRHRRVPGCRHANDTAAYDQPTAATGGTQARMASRTSAASSTSPAIGVRWEGKSGVITCTCASS